MDSLKTKGKTVRIEVKEKDSSSLGTAGSVDEYQGKFIRMSVKHQHRSARGIATSL